MSGLALRPYAPADAAALAQVFHRAVRKGTAAHYWLPQRLAWSPRPRPAADWHARLSQIETVVAERDGQPVGFMALDLSDGFLDFAYVAPELRGQGVGAALYAVLEGRARAARIALLETAASRVAEPFFARRGWRVLRRQSVRRHGIALPNAVMQKPLLAGDLVA